MLGVHLFDESPMEIVWLKLITKEHLIIASVNVIFHVLMTQFHSFNCGWPEGSNGAGRKK